MPSPILPITGIPVPDLRALGITTPGTASTGQLGAFQSVLEKTIQNVENSRAQATTAVDQFLSGQSEEIHSVALASQRAELSTEMFLQVRNKVIQAYQEVMKLQL